MVLQILGMVLKWGLQREKTIPIKWVTRTVLQDI